MLKYISCLLYEDRRENMDYIIHYDVAGFVVILAILFHYMATKRIETKVTTVFLMLICCQAIAAVLDVVTALMIDDVIVVSVPALYVWNMLYLMSCNTITPLFLCYLIYTTKIDSGLSLKERMLIWLPLLVDYILILTTAFTHAVFYIDENGEYKHNSMFFVLYVISIIYLIMSIVLVAKNKEKFINKQQNIVYIYILVTMLSVIIQWLIPGLLIIQFSASITFFLVYLSLENPDDYQDKKLGIYNRDGFNLNVGIALEKKKKFRLVGIYIQGLKFLNETIGVENKQIIIHEISEFLCSLNGSDNVFRLSNTKFVIKIEDDSEQEKLVIDKIVERFNETFDVNNVMVPLVPAMAILCCPDDADTLDNIVDLMDYSLNELVENTDKLILRASEESVTKRQREGQVLQVLTKAIHDNGFEMYYQPIYEVKKKRFTSAEALVRMKNTSIGFVGPDEFIPLAEKNGMILELGEFVFKTVCQFIKDNQIWKYGIEQIHINLSVVQCMQENLAQNFLDIMKEMDLPSERIKLEVTETAAVVSSACLSMNMNVMVDQGISFALDDYGTGFSNAVSLIEYPYNTIKIDKSVIWAALDNENANKVLRHSISMFKSLNMDIVAEGVETLEQANELTEMGCDFFQGYYYSKPIPGDAFIEFVKQQAN